jgi:hypothetical protein
LGVAVRDGAAAESDLARQADFEDDLVGDICPRDDNGVDGRNLRGGVESSSMSISPELAGIGRLEGNSSSESGDVVFSSGTNLDPVASSVSVSALPVER